MSLSSLTYLQLSGMMIDLESRLQELGREIENTLILHDQGRSERYTRQQEQMSPLEEQMSPLANKIHRLIKKQARLKDLAEIESEITKVTKATPRLEKLQARLEKLQTRLHSVDVQAKTLETRFSLENRLVGTYQDKELYGLQARISLIDLRIQQLLKQAEEEGLEQTDSIYSLFLTAQRLNTLLKPCFTRVSQMNLRIQQLCKHVGENHSFSLNAEQLSTALFSSLGD